MKAYRLNKNRFLLVSHPHYPSRFPYFNRLYALICFHIGTINLAFRRGGACSSRCTEPLHPHNLLKNTSTASPRTMSLPPLSKVRCCRPKEFGRLPEGLSLHQPSQNRTIPLTFLRVSVCVCLVGFASLQSPWAHTLKASLPLYERYVGFASCKAFGRSFQASLPLYERSVGFASLQSLWAFISGILALLAPPVAPNLSIPTTFSKTHQPLRPAPCPCLPCQRGGGLTASQNRYSTSSSFCNLPDCFPNCYTFCRQDGGDCVCLEDLKIVLLSISIPTVTARNSFRIVKAGLSEYSTASQKNFISRATSPFSRGGKKGLQFMLLSA